MNLLVSWSTAFDYIMKFDDSFQNHIHPEKIHQLNVSFLINDMRRESWGTWLNIAYNLALLWDEPILLTAIGKDFSFSSFIEENVNLKYVHKSEELFSAAWYITTDNWENQITAFYPWAMNEADTDLQSEINEDVYFWIVSPNKKEAMIKHLFYMKNKWIKVFYDPGQALFSFSKDELNTCAQYADFLIVNDYEYWVFKENIWKTDEELLEIFEAIVVTFWHEGSEIRLKDEVIKIPVVKNSEVVDPTGAWDAYRAWLLRGLQMWNNWELSWKLWSMMASVSVWKHGWQNHYIWKQAFQTWFCEVFDEKIYL